MFYKLMGSVDKMTEGKYEILGVALGIIGITLLTVDGVSIQALDKSVPLFQLNVTRLIGKAMSIYQVKSM